MRSAGTRLARHEADAKKVHQTTDQSTVTVTCRTCRETKPVAEMAPDLATSTGYRSQCRICRRDYDRDRYQNFDEAHRRARDWASAHRRRARRYGLHLVTEVVVDDGLRMTL